MNLVSTVVVACVAALSCVGSGLAVTQSSAPPVAQVPSGWGEAQDGIRLGIDIKSESDSSGKARIILIAVLSNMTVHERVVPSQSPERDYQIEVVRTDGGTVEVTERGRQLASPPVIRTRSFHLEHVGAGKALLNEIVLCRLVKLEESVEYQVRVSRRVPSSDGRTFITLVSNAALLRPRS